MIFILSIIFSLSVDIFTKNLASKYLIEKIDIINNFFYLKYVENEWIAFSIWIPYLKLVTVVLILIIIYYYFREEIKKREPLIDISFWFILWWAIWNGIERIMNWKVIDFIWINHFSVLNMADVFITLWAFIYIVRIIIFNKW